MHSKTVRGYETNLCIPFAFFNNLVYIRANTPITSKYKKLIMADYTELEIGLFLREGDDYTIELRFNDPQDQAGVDKFMG